MNYKASIIGFHNPKKHKGMFADDFLLLYIKNVLLGKKYSKERYSLAKWIEKNFDNQVIFVKKLFPNTLVYRNKESVDNQERKQKMDCYWFSGWQWDFIPYQPSRGNGKFTIRIPGLRKVFSVTFPKYKEKEIRSLAILIKLTFSYLDKLETCFKGDEENDNKGLFKSY